MSEKDRVIAIDGPSGSGKSTIAYLLADKLSFLYVDTGAMFRGVSLALHKEGIPFEEGDALKDYLEILSLEYEGTPSTRIILNGKDFSEEIREHRVSEIASKVSLLPSVRNYLLETQRKIGLEKFCVMEGRDIGTVVFPNSFCKFFITASLEDRVQRRFEQLKEEGNPSIALQEVRRDLIARDRRDEEREVAPLKKAYDAILIDTSRKELEQNLDSLLLSVREAGAKLGLEL